MASGKPHNNQDGATTARHYSASLVLEVIGLIVLVGYTTFAALQWRVNKKAADASTSAAETVHRSLVAQQRPWVGLVQNHSLEPYDMSIKPAPNHAGQEIRVDSRITLRNLGISPAMHVVPVVLIANESDIENQLRAACKNAEEVANGIPQQTDMPKRGQLLFPQDIWTEPEILTAKIQDLPRVARLLGCIAYTDEFRQRHQTRFCFEVPVRAAKHSTDITVCSAYNNAD